MLLHMIFVLVLSFQSASLLFPSNLARTRQGSNQIILPLGVSPEDLEHENGSEESPYKTWEKADKAAGLYVHIPYCRRRCRYCDFAILPVGPNIDPDTSPSSNQEDGFEAMNRSYLAALAAEIRSIQVPLQHPIPLRSIYFGGGTPSLAPVETIAEILHAACRCEDSPFVLDSDAEVTIEMDPGTFSTEKLFALKDLGINRISLGIQSFNDDILETVGRVHRRADISKALQSIETVFEDANYSIDLISGVPGLSLAMWTETLETVVSLKPRPKHLSIYDLQIEKGTVFSTWYGNSQIQHLPRLPSEEECAFMYKYTAGYLKAKNYEHYEVSSYAHRTSAEASPFRSRHNQIYWSLSSSWYAIGLGATSFVDGKMLARPRTLVDYLAWVYEDQGIATGKGDGQEFLTDIVMKRLRTSDGLNLQWLRDNFGHDVMASVLKGARLGLDLGLAEIIGPDKETLVLTDPEGFLFSNYVISSVFAELEP